ncbi:hypothetical protein TURU_083541 [Turdus rufiventris]|nr:hypothetical protein TURU_083541 [Turdus rufiventris]
MSHGRVATPGQQGMALQIAQGLAGCGFCVRCLREQAEGSCEPTIAAAAELEEATLTTVPIVSAVMAQEFPKLSCLHLSAWHPYKAPVSAQSGRFQPKGLQMDLTFPKDSRDFVPSEHSIFKTGTEEAGNKTSSEGCVQLSISEHLDFFISSPEVLRDPKDLHWSSAGEKQQRLNGTGRKNELTAGSEFLLACGGVMSSTSGAFHKNRSSFPGDSFGSHGPTAPPASGKHLPPAASKTTLVIVSCNELLKARQAETFGEEDDTPTEAGAVEGKEEKAFEYHRIMDCSIRQKIFLLLGPSSKMGLSLPSTIVLFQRKHVLPSTILSASEREDKSENPSLCYPGPSEQEDCFVVKALNWM